MIISKHHTDKLRQLEERYKIKRSARPKCVAQAPYTFVEIEVDGKRFNGFAKASPRDKYDENIGFNIAAARALKQAAA